MLLGVIKSFILDSIPLSILETLSAPIADLTHPEAISFVKSSKGRNESVLSEDRLCVPMFLDV